MPKFAIMILSLYWGGKQMIDFNYYANIGNVATMLGGMKKAALNKKQLAAAEQSWDRLPQEVVMRINQEIPGGKQIMNSSYIVPSAILVMSNHALFVIPSYDIIWLYGHVVKNSMNFIPTDKEHILRLVDRNGETHVMGMSRTLAFSKKDPCGDAINEVRPFLATTRPGALLGWTDEIANGIQNNFAGMVQMVDSQG
jgi:hypothetical protein